ncbi:hypothetical protein Hsw_2759 [Hymenobacter swuensis DY53]|uniref:Uncharacterized protein n=1 Tax=Hymenobacter swuensis DY53 TaxID=1227739 RepID=W8EZ11_9BACT|nr:hypothetical protein Hsw_2759 [Hymenobacter swuensis DY53]
MNDWFWTSNISNDETKNIASLHRSIQAKRPVNDRAFYVST